MSGGFFAESDSQNVDSPSKFKNNSAPQGIRAVTIKQVQDAEVNSDGRLVMDSHEVNQFSFVACVRGIKEASTGTDYFMEDGTSSITGRCWPDKNIAPAKEGEWVNVTGTCKTVASSKTVNVLALKKVTDYNQITFHFLETIAGSLAISDSNFLNPTSKSSSRKETKVSHNPSYYEDQNLTPIQKAVYAVYRGSRDEVGVNTNTVIRSLQGKYSDKDIRDSVASLVSDGLIYYTIDSEHARNISG